MLALAACTTESAPARIGASAQPGASTERACLASAPPFASLPLPVRSAQIACVLDARLGANGIDQHRFYQLVDGRSLYVFETTRKPAPESRAATAQIDGSVQIEALPFTYRLFEPSTGADPANKPELYLTGTVRGVYIELALQVAPPLERVGVLAELTGLMREIVRTP